MTTRRSFFTRLAQFAAVVAIAPQIAFGKKLVVYPECFSVPEMIDACEKARRYWTIDPILYRHYILGDWGIYEEIDKAYDNSRTQAA